MPGRFGRDARTGCSCWYGMFRAGPVRAGGGVFFRDHDRDRDHGRSPRSGQRRCSVITPTPLITEDRPGPGSCRVIRDLGESGSWWVSGRLFPFRFFELVPRRVICVSGRTCAVLRHGTAGATLLSEAGVSPIVLKNRPTASSAAVPSSALPLFVLLLSACCQGSAVFGPFCEVLWPSQIYWFRL